MCGLRLSYIPRHGYSGKYKKALPRPEEVQRAFRIAESKAEQDFTAIRFKAYLEMAKGELRLENPQFCRKKPTRGVNVVNVPRNKTPDHAAAAAERAKPEDVPSAGSMTDAVKRLEPDTPR